MKKIFALVLVAGLTSAASAQVVTGFSGGSRFGGYYTDSDDVIGFRFTARGDSTVTALGVWFDDGTLDAPHTVGLWLNSTMTLIARAEVDNTGTLIGDWYYTDISPVSIVAGERYTLGAMYHLADGDSYVSSPTTVDLDGIEATNGVYPFELGLGFVYPENDSSNLARFGPNMLLGTGCYADCDTSTGVGVLDIFDFLCFQDSFVSGGTYACDCDTSTGQGICDIFDFLCFQDAFVAGCP